jgi:hypothetical protein
LNTQGTTVELNDVLQPEQLAVQLANMHHNHVTASLERRALMAEIKRYIFATDTTKTTNSKLPWKNKTSRPKLCQIRDNLVANYIAALFPKRTWLEWIGNTDEDQKKKDSIELYIQNVIEQPAFQSEVVKALHDYVDEGNAFATTVWTDDTVTNADNSVKQGFVGPQPRRISPSDIQFNPLATQFYKTGKFVTALMTMGDFASLVESEPSVEKKEQAKQILEYCRNVRSMSQTGQINIVVKDAVYHVSGFSNFLNYLNSGYIEVLTFSGDYYDIESGMLYKNKNITIVDRHKLVFIKDNDDALSGDGIHHVGWRERQDNLWAMGPLENLVGLQYRIDHLENLKADVFDLIAFPPLKIKGSDVDDFTWAPFEKIYVGDGDVEVMSPDVNALTANLEIANIEQAMEEYAGSPKEAMGFRTPGEKTMYEVQRLENAASRVFTAKIRQFETYFLEPLLNDHLKMAQKYLTTAVLRQVDPELDAVQFSTITREDLQGSGRIRPLAARHFAEKAELVQNLNSFFSSPIGQDESVKMHFSGLKFSKMFEDLLDFKQYNIVTPFVRLSETAEAQRIMNAGTEDTMMQAQQPAGINPDDVEEPITGEQPIEGATNQGPV